MSVVAYIDLSVWKEARSVVKIIYNRSKSFSVYKQYGITSLLRRAVVSISSNMAEGCGRNSSKETIYFFHVSRGSIYEVESLIYRSLDRDYIKEQNVKNYLTGFISYYEKK